MIKMARHLLAAMLLATAGVSHAEDIVIHAGHLIDAVQGVDRHS